MIYPELLSLCTLFVCMICIITSVKLFGKSGLFVYTAAATIASNSQVLKLTHYSIIDHPVALGTVVFSSVFAVDNIMTEYYGAEAAKKNVMLSFFGYIFFVIIMKIAVLHPPVTASNCTNLHEQFNSIFSPGFILLVSSLLAYLIAQTFDIYIFAILKKITQGRYLSCRTFITMAASAFVDNFLFSFFAWIVFAPKPITMSELWHTYMVVTYLLRLFIAVLCVPLVRLTGIIVFKDQDVQKF